MDDQTTPAVGAEATAPLEGTPWRLAAYRDASGALVPARTDAPHPADAARLRRAVIGFAGGAWRGSVGCNELSGTYAARGAALRMELDLMTLRNCHGPPMAQEAGFLAAVPTVAAYRIAGQVLELLRADRAVAVRFFATASDAARPAELSPHRGSP